MTEAAPAHETCPTVRVGAGIVEAVIVSVTSGSRIAPAGRIEAHSAGAVQVEEMLEPVNHAVPPAWEAHAAEAVADGAVVVEAGVGRHG